MVPFLIMAPLKIKIYKKLILNIYVEVEISCNKEFTYSSNFTDARWSSIKRN